MEMRSNTAILIVSTLALIFAESFSQASVYNNKRTLLRRRQHDKRSYWSPTWSGHKRTPPLDLLLNHRQPEVISECVTVSARPGEYRYTAAAGPESTGETVCGFFIVADAAQIVKVEMTELDVSCGDGGLVAFFDGWEMNGKVFPNEYDHASPMSSRAQEMCGRAEERITMPTMYSSQNAALVQFRVPSPGQGFAFRVSFVQNPDPCNILMDDHEGVFTLSTRGDGVARNCTLTTLLFAGNFQILESTMSGVRSGEEGPDAPRCHGGCETDLVQFGGSSDLETALLDASETLCSCHARRYIRRGMTAFCSSSTFRLVSSGRYDNSVTIRARAASESDIDFNSLMVMCPDFMA